MIFNSMIKKYDSQYDKSNDFNEAEIRAARESANAKAAKISETVSIYEQKNSEKDKYTNELTTAQDENIQINNAYTAALNGLRGAQVELRNAQSIPVRITKNPDGSITKDTSERDAAINRAELLIEAAKAELDEINSQKEDVNREIDELNKEIENTQKDLDRLQQEKDKAEQELEQTEAYIQKLEDEAAAAKSRQEAEANKKEDSETKPDNNIFINGIKTEEEEKEEEEPQTEVIESITTEETEALSHDATILLNQELYSEEEIKEAKENVSNIAGKEYNESDDLVSQYVNLAKELEDVNTDNNIEIRDEVLDLLSLQNLQDGVAPEITKTLVQAIKEVGTSEDIGEDGTGNNAGAILKYGGAAGDPWCASFVSWLYGDSQGINFKEIFPKEYADIGVYEMKQSAEEKGLYHTRDEYTPSPGDIIIVGGGEHTGIVAKEDNDFLYTIEGNANDAVRARKYPKNSDKYANISGYISMQTVFGGETPKYIEGIPDEKYELVGEEYGIY